MCEFKFVCVSVCVTEIEKEQRREKRKEKRREKEGRGDTEKEGGSQERALASPQMLELGWDPLSCGCISVGKNVCFLLVSAWSLHCLFKCWLGHAGSLPTVSPSPRNLYSGRRWDREEAQRIFISSWTLSGGGWVALSDGKVSPGLGLLPRGSYFAPEDDFPREFKFLHFYFPYYFLCIFPCYSAYFFSLLYVSLMFS